VALSNDHITVLLRKLDINGYLPFKTRYSYQLAN